MKRILKSALAAAVILAAMSAANAASEASSVARCEIRGEEGRKVFVNCPGDLSPRDVLSEVLSIREKKTTPDQTEISIYVFSGERTPASSKEMQRIPERGLQKIQSAVYSNYPNGETDYFCKKNGRMQKCRELLSKH